MPESYSTVLKNVWRESEIVESPCNTDESETRWIIHQTPGLELV
jgi:hypothetical protein